MVLKIQSDFTFTNMGLKIKSDLQSPLKLKRKISQKKND